ncbi:MAG: amidohydrolase family protein [Gammaproteobacteria bacterium]|nr:amidohydrolase family protein [Gammaproteobacteria bacterium]MDH4255473.1 amidohydrolase family protein [Gammaproteobacteria bacterium]MDH5309512.1 amidohydrolase family protein [Gammaproteobacteria bacterium]
MSARLRIPTLVLLLAAAACSRQDAATGLPALTVDLLLTGGQVYDGSGAAPVFADVGIRGDRIVFIGDGSRPGLSAQETLDASGLWIAPGFIDAHSHAELDRDYGRDGLPFLYQGITSVVLGLDGDGDYEVAATLDRWADSGIGVNGLLFVGHGAVREAVMGLENRAPDEAEMETMRALVRKGMDEGAFGLSTGLFYVPGSYASTEEIIELARIAAGYEGAIYDTHDRDLGAVHEGVGYDASVREGIRIARESGLRAIFSHYNLQGAHNYGRGDAAAKYINDARAQGIDVWAAQHPYDATQSNLRSYTIPDWAAAGGQEAMRQRFDDPATSAEILAATRAMLDIRGGAERIVFADPRPELNGKTLADVARERELEPAAAVQSLLRDGNASVMNRELYDHANTRRLAQESWMMTCTDGRTPQPDQPITHPRAYGAFPMKMRLFVFDEPLLRPEFVIRSFSGLAADFYRLPDRGYLREGYAADVAIIDPTIYRDRATYEEPRRFATGAVHVLVNGEFAIRDGRATGVLAGKPLRRPE